MASGEGVLLSIKGRHQKRNQCSPLLQRRIGPFRFERNITTGVAMMASGRIQSTGGAIWAQEAPLREIEGGGAHVPTLPPGSAYATI